MKFIKILKEKKALTPIMIGIIVAAALLTILFIVLTATIPLMRHDVYITIPPETIKGNETNRESLQVNIVCDYATGRLTKIQIYDSALELCGVKTLDILFPARNETKLMIDYFEDPDMPSEHLLFTIDEQYFLKITYENLAGDEIVSENIAFFYRDRQ